VLLVPCSEPLELSEQLMCYGQFLHFFGAFIDFNNFRILVKSLDGIFIDVTVPPPSAFAGRHRPP
jgi:hypothetical protein